MAEEKYTLETMYQIWNDETGTHIDIGPDRSCTDLVEIRSYTDDGQIGARITFCYAELARLQNAIGFLLGS